MNLRSRGCTAESGSLCEHLVVSLLPSAGTRRARTGQRLAIVGGGRGRDARVFQLLQLSTGLGGLGFEVVDNGACSEKMLDKSIMARNPCTRLRFTLGHHIADA